MIIPSLNARVLLNATAPPKRQPYALCGKDGDHVSVNLVYIIQLGVLCELSTLDGYPKAPLRMWPGWNRPADR